MVIANDHYQSIGIVCLSVIGAFNVSHVSGRSASIRVKIRINFRVRVSVTAIGVSTAPLINASQWTPMHHMSTNLGVNSSSRFSFRARTHTQTHKVTNHHSHASASADVGNNSH